MAEGLVEAFVEEISTLEGPARMTDFFNAFYKKHGTDKVGLREALEAPTSGTWANALGDKYADKIEIINGHFYPLSSLQTPAQSNKQAGDTHPALPLGLANHVEGWKGTVARFISTGAPMKKRQNRRSIVVAADGTPCPTCGRSLRTQGKRRGTFATVEHIIPLSLGGDNTYSGSYPQCVAMCHDCNTVRNSLVVRERAKKTSSSAHRFDDLVEFLILQVYDPDAVHGTPHWKAFEREFTLKTQRRPEPISSRTSATAHPVPTKQRRQLVVVPHLTTNPASLIHQIPLDRLESQASRTVIIRQEDATHIDLHGWIALDFQPMMSPYGASDLHLGIAKLAYQHNGLVDLYIHAEFSSAALDSLITAMGGHVVEFTAQQNRPVLARKRGWMGWLKSMFQTKRHHPASTPKQSEEDNLQGSLQVNDHEVAALGGQGLTEAKKESEPVHPSSGDDAPAVQVSAELPALQAVESAKTDIRIPLVNTPLEGANFLLPFSIEHATDILISINRLLPSVTSMREMNEKVLSEMQDKHPSLAKSRVNRSISKFVSSMKAKDLMTSLPSKTLSSDELVDVVNALKEHWEARVDELTPVGEENAKEAEEYFSNISHGIHRHWRQDSTAAGPPTSEKIAHLTEQDLELRKVMETALSDGPMSMAAFIAKLAAWQRSEQWNESGAKGLAVHHGLPPKTPVNETLDINYSDLVSVSGPQGRWVVSLVRGIEVTSTNEDGGQNE